MTRVIAFGLVAATLTVANGWAGPFAYIPAVDRVVVIDAATDAVVATIALPGSAAGAGVAVAPDGARAYVAGGARISVIDTATNTVAARFDSGTGEVAIAVAPTEPRVFVSTMGGGHIIDRAIYVNDSATLASVARIGIDHFPGGIAVSPDGAELYVAALAKVIVINTATYRVESLPLEAAGARYIVFAPDGTRAYVADSVLATVSVIDTARRDVLATIPVGARPSGISIGPDGAKVFVCNASANTVSVIGTTSNSVIATVPVGLEPMGVDVTPDGTRAYVLNYRDGSVSVIDTASNTVVRPPIAVGSGPAALGRFIGPAVPPPPRLTAAEYYHGTFGHYFVTALDAEIDALDTGEFAGWTRTGQSFNVFGLGSGAARVCRFWSGQTFAPKSSHFHTPLARECEIVKGNGDWIFEGLPFAWGLADEHSGACLPGTVPVYRLYNDGHGDAPNHRYTTSPAIRAEMAAAGWIPEGSGPQGVIGCVPAP